MACLLVLGAVLLVTPAKSYAEEPGEGAGTAFSYPEHAPDAEPSTLDIDPGPPDPEDTPIDGGLAILLAAGGLYGLYKYRYAQQPACTGNAVAA